MPLNRPNPARSARRARPRSSTSRIRTIRRACTCSGAAPYIDDIREPAGHAARRRRPGRQGARDGCAALDLAAVRAAPGVVAVLTAADIPGRNDIAPAFADEPLLADDEILFHGQAVFAVVAETRDAARRAARLGQDRHRGGEARAHRRRRAGDRRARAARLRLRPRRRRGARSPPRRAGSKASSRIGGQEHFYLEGQVVARHSRRRRAR